VKALTNRKLDGFISLLWAVTGFLAIELGCFHPTSEAGEFFLVLGLWWGVAMLLAVSGLKSRSGPGVLTSICTILLFIGFLWLSVPRIGPKRLSRPAAAARQLSCFETALGAFHADTRFFPAGTNGLRDLLQKPAGTTNWHGPYLPALLRDPWNQDYQYECPGRHNPHSYDIGSPGPPGANAPIGNWKQNPG
jgi:general secretion pathway protein G